LNSTEVTLPFDEEVKSGPGAPLAKTYVLNGKTIGNRFVILPMEGWESTTDEKLELTTMIVAGRLPSCFLPGIYLIRNAEASLMSAGYLVFDSA